jgi:hypothetical protein
VREESGGGSGKGGSGVSGGSEGGDSEGEDGGGEKGHRAQVRARVHKDRFVIPSQGTDCEG